MYATFGENIFFQEVLVCDVWGEKNQEVLVCDVWGKYIFHEVFVCDIGVIPCIGEVVPHKSYLFGFQCSLEVKDFFRFGFVARAVIECT